jgi:hypothetical protein
MSVYRRPNERYIDACVHECDRFGGRSVMVWAGITHCGRTDLKIVNGNLNAVRYHVYVTFIGLSVYTHSAITPSQAET